MGKGGVIGGAQDETSSEWESLLLREGSFIKSDAPDHPKITESTRAWGGDPVSTLNHRNYDTVTDKTIAKARWFCL